jgi:hypothetical protein
MLDAETNKNGLEAGATTAVSGPKTEGEAVTSKPEAGAKTAAREPKTEAEAVTSKREPEAETAAREPKTEAEAEKSMPEAGAGTGNAKHQNPRRAYVAMSASSYAGALLLIFGATIVALWMLVPPPCGKDKFLCERDGWLASWLDQQSARHVADKTTFSAQISSLLAAREGLPQATAKSLDDATETLVTKRYEDFFSEVLASSPTHREQEAIEAGRRLGSASGRLTWTTAYAMLLAALVTAIIACLFSSLAVAQSRDRPDGARGLLVVGCLVAMAFGFYIWYNEYTQSATGPAWLQFPKTTLQVFVEQKLQDDLSWYLTITDSLFAAAAVLILTVIALRVGKSRAIDVNLQAAWLADSRYLISRLALLLMLILIVSIAHTQALLTWPLAQVGGCDLANRQSGSPLASVCGMVGELVTAYGVVATIVLGSLLLPGVGLLTARCRTLAVEAAPENPSDWLKGKELAVSGWDQAGRLIIVLAPLVSGLLVPYVSGIAKQLTP